jgi:membrane-bound serine protease (ClpP class)
MTLRRIVCSLLFVLGILVLTASQALAQDSHVDVAAINGEINPITAGYVDRVVSQAEADGAKALVIRMDTPGGLDTSMRQIIQRILGAKVPVVVYVSPPGSRAGSAGVYITYASHVAAMAPNTNIGAAHPVAVDQNGQEQQLSATMQEKVTNDAVAYIQSLANQRGRNVDWAEQAVRQSVSITEQQALKTGVVEIVAPDVPSLLSQLDGRSVRMADGSSVVLQTRNATINVVSQNWIESFLEALSNPTIAYILLSLGLMALFFELANPGAILPGVIGGIFLLLAFFSLGSLPVNYAGLSLMGFAFILFVADALGPTHGVLTVGAIISLTLGSLLLFNTSLAGPTPIALPVIAATIACISAYFIFVVNSVVRSRRRRVVAGREAMIGKIGQARSDLNPMGTIYIRGELWKAISEEGLVTEGEKVEVIGIEGLTLRVVKAPEIPEFPLIPD